MILTPAFEFTKALTTSSTASSFTSLVATTTKPTGDGVVAWGGLDAPAGVAQNSVLLVPFGEGADNTTFSMRVTGWRKVSTLWIPVHLLQLDCTLSAKVGVASASVTNTDRFADTISKASGQTNAEVVSPTGDILAYAVMDGLGFELLQFTFDMTGATNGNCLLAPL